MNKYVTAALGLVFLHSLHSPHACAAEQAAEQPSQRLQSLVEMEQQPPASRTLNIHGWKAPTGGKVLFIRTTELPIIDLHVSFAAGSAHDGAHPGLAAATFSLINEGVPGKDLAAIMETFDGLGARFDMNINHDRVTFSLRSLAADDKREPALHLFNQLLGQPVLSDEALKRVKSQLHELIEAQRLNPDVQINQALRETLLPGHPYARPVFGTSASVSALSHAQILAFHRQAYSATGTLITLVGDLTVEQAQALSLQVINALPASAAMPATLSPLPSDAINSRHIERPSSQTHILLGQPGVAVQHPDYLALKVAHVIFGGQRLNSRLMTELREKRGLTYTAQLQTPAWQAASLAIIDFKTRPQYRDGSVAMVQTLYADFLRDGPTQQELDDAKAYLRSSNALNSASNAQILSRLVEINQFDLPLDLDFSVSQVQNLTVAQIKAALNRQFDAKKWSVVTLGPTVDQQPLPPPASGTAGHMCRADTGNVAS